MLYQYRWIFALIVFAIISGLSYFYIFYPSWSNLTQLQAVEEKLKKELTMLNLLKTNSRFIRSIQTNAKKSKSPMQMLAALVALINSNHLSVQSIAQTKTSLCHDCMLTHAILQGNINQLVNFFISLRKEDGMFIKEFSSSVINFKQIAVIVDIVQFNAPVPNKAKFKNLNNKEFAHLFCLGKYQDGFFDRPMMLQMLPLTSLKFIGFIQWNNQRQAMLQLPDHTIESVAMSAIVGKEHARLIKIAAQQIVFVLPNHKTWIINRD